MMWARWTLPRLRIDQVMTTCLKYCVPLSAACFIGALAWQAFGIPFLNDVAPVAGAGKPAVREAWWLEAERRKEQALSEDTTNNQVVSRLPLEGGER